MTIEEKAKAYDEAIERGKQIQTTPYTANWDIMKEVAEHLLPELKESEDERIRKALIEYFNEQCDMSDWNGVYGYQVVAWLEKQGKISPILSNSSNIVKNWDEEDEKRVKNILSVLNAQVCWDGATGKKMNPYQKEIDWLKSLSLQGKEKLTD